MLFAIGLTSAVLYSSLLPLWNGFDKPFHYSYVETIVLERHFPQLGQTRITREVGDSLALTPVSRFLRDLAPDSIAVEHWAELPDRERLRRREALDGLSPDLRRRPASLLNYESQRSPLAHLVLGPFDALLGRTPLRLRILLLRLLGSVASAPLLYFAGLRLCRGLDSKPVWATAALFCVFLTQMLWASIAHVGDDALAIPVNGAVPRFFGIPHQISGGSLSSCCSPLYWPYIPRWAYVIGRLRLLCRSFLRVPGIVET